MVQSAIIRQHPPAPSLDTYRTTLAAYRASLTEHAREAALGPLPADRDAAAREATRRVQLRGADFGGPTDADRMAAAFFEQYCGLMAGAYAIAQSQLASPSCSNEDRNLVFNYERRQAEEAAAAELRAQYQLGEAACELRLIDPRTEIAVVGQYVVASGVPRPVDLRAAA